MVLIELKQSTLLTSCSHFDDWFYLQRDLYSDFKDYLFSLGYIKSLTPVLSTFHFADNYSDNGINHIFAIDISL
jgi:hypothetical protein